MKNLKTLLLLAMMVLVAMFSFACEDDDSIGEEMEDAGEEMEDFGEDVEDEFEGSLLILPADDLA